jgi:hypothetical protein
MFFKINDPAKDCGGDERKGDGSFHGVELYPQLKNHQLQNRRSFRSACD